MLDVLNSIDARSIDRKAQLLDLDRADCEQSLYRFFSSAWRYIDAAPWVDGWCMQAIAEHLQAVCDGQIKRLLINISPRCSKSALCSITFPAWVWAQPDRGPISGPGVPFLHASYANQLSLRDSVKCRRLIESPWYQERWGDRFKLTSDQNTKSRFSNDQGGERLITSIDGTNTGEGGMCIVIDDPNSVDDVDSEASIQTVIDWWEGTMPTRLNNQDDGAYIVIQQRTFENDLTGHILATEAEDWTHLMIPMRYESDRSYFTPIGWKDPRTIEGELMWPERFSEAATSRLERRLGSWRASGQLQQRPDPAGGGIIKRAWWQLWEGDVLPRLDYSLACLDTAYTEEELNDPSGMMVWGVFTQKVPEGASRITRADHRQEPIMKHKIFDDGAPRVIMCHAWEDRLTLHELVKKVVATCRAMKVDLLLIENKASGIAVAQEIRRMFADERYGVQFFDPKSQDKVARLISVQHLFEEGIIFAPSETFPWVEKVISQVGMFPKGKHDEFVDLTSMGLRYLRGNGLIARAQEVESAEEAAKQYRSPTQALYPV